MGIPTSAPSRREFLKLTAGLLAGAAWRPDPPEPPLAPLGLGRAIQMLPVYDAPSFGAAQIDRVPADTVLTLLEAYAGPLEDARPGTAHNLVWYRAQQGWLHSAFVQPVRRDLNAPLPAEAIPPGGLLAEVTVPFTDAWHASGRAGRLGYRLYYSQTHWVDRAATDESGQLWYRILDDRRQVHYVVQAEHLRPIPPEELAPISPEVTDKRIEVNLRQQRLVAYENGAEVFSARLASGLGGATPTGELRVAWKRPSRHMAGPGFDLPGVPWVTYFHWNGSALHGAYWHNDYGRPRSHGCLNLLPEAAKWLYRWTTPVVPPETVVLREPGTAVLIA